MDPEQSLPPLEVSKGREGVLTRESGTAELSDGDYICVSIQELCDNLHSILAVNTCRPAESQNWVLSALNTWGLPSMA